MLADQAPIYRALAERLHQDLPCLGLGYEDQVVALRSEATGYRLAADGNADDLGDLRIQVVPAARSLASSRR